MLYALNLHYVISQLHLNKAGGQKISLLLLFISLITFSISQIIENLSEVLKWSLSKGIHLVNKCEIGLID